MLRALQAVFLITECTQHASSVSEKLVNHTPRTLDGDCERVLKVSREEVSYDWGQRRQEKKSTMSCAAVGVSSVFVRTFRSSLRVVLIDEQPKLIIRGHPLHELFAILLFSLPSIFLRHEKATCQRRGGSNKSPSREREDSCETRTMNAGGLDSPFP